MADILDRLNKLCLSLILAALLALPTAASYAQDGGGDLPAAPPDTDISDICTPSKCSPATPCPDPDEKCYAVEGAFYCCVMPPVPGMEAVGD